MYVPYNLCQKNRIGILKTISFCLKEVSRIRCICLKDYFIRSLFLICSPLSHRVKWCLSMSFFLMLVTFKKYYPFRGSTYATDGLKTILVIWCAVKKR